jgi:hypothetical protein
MNFYKPKRKNDDELILYARNRWDALIFTGWGIIIMFGFMFFSSDVQTLIASERFNSVMRCVFFPLLPVLLVLVIWSWLRFCTYLIIHPEGIEWVRGGSSRLNVSWDLTQSFQAYRVSENGSIIPTLTVVDLKLNATVKPEISHFIARLLYGRSTNTIRLSEYTQVPWGYMPASSNNFTDNLPGLLLNKQPYVNKEEFKRTDVGAKLFQYAPHLFRK